MRVEWELKDFKIRRSEIAERFTPLAERLDMQWRLHFSDAAQRIAIMVSKYSHCLYDLLLRSASAELPGNIALVISNHPDLKTVPERFGIPFHVFPIELENKKEQEEKELKLLQIKQIDLVVLARYMQILGPEFAATYPNRIINIHHSFLPAFIPLRHRAIGRRADHRTGHCANQPPCFSRRSDPQRPRSGKSRLGAGGPPASRISRSPIWQKDSRIRLGAASGIEQNE